MILHKSSSSFRHKTLSNDRSRACQKRAIKFLIDQITICENIDLAASHGCTNGFYWWNIKW